MGAKQLDLINQRFNRLTVIEKNGVKIYGKSKKRMWKCKCDCGNIITTNTGALTSNNTKSCGCLHDELSADIGRKSRYKLANPESGYKSIMTSYKANAKLRNYKFELTFDEFKKLILSNCHYCGVEPSNIYFRNYYNINYNGIDRINNDVGYLTTNVVPCCKICNIAKNNYTHNEFLKWIDRLVNKRIIDSIS